MFLFSYNFVCIDGDKFKASWSNENISLLFIQESGCYSIRPHDPHASFGDRTTLISHAVVPPAAAKGRISILGILCVNMLSDIISCLYFGVPTNIFERTMW